MKNLVSVVLDSNSLGSQFHLSLPSLLPFRRLSFTSPPDNSSSFSLPPHIPSFSLVLPFRIALCSSSVPFFSLPLSASLLFSLLSAGPVLASASPLQSDASSTVVSFSLCFYEFFFSSFQSSHW